MFGVRDAIAFILYGLGSVFVLRNAFLVGRALLLKARGKTPRNESLNPLIGSALVAVGLIVAWPILWLRWVGVALLVIDPGGIQALFWIALANWPTRPSKKPD